jgi:hypothetical protein
MTIKQAKRDFSIPGTKRLRKQWQIAKNRGKEPFRDRISNVPNTFIAFEPNPISKEQRIYNSILTKVQRVAISN